MRTTKLSDECGIRQTSINTDVLVNQDGDRVVVNSGRMTLTGTTNEHDGFDVSTDAKDLGGCFGAGAYSFRDASDGEAVVGLALSVQCGGRTCTAGFGGTAQNLDGRSARTASGDNDEVDDVLESCTGWGA